MQVYIPAELRRFPSQRPVNRLPVTADMTAECGCFIWAKGQHRGTEGWGGAAGGGGGGAGGGGSINIHTNSINDTWRHLSKQIQKWRETNSEGVNNVNTEPMRIQRQGGICPLEATLTLTNKKGWGINFQRISLSFFTLEVSFGGHL